jgi:hypothetical protein
MSFLKVRCLGVSNPCKLCRDLEDAERRLDSVEVKLLQKAAEKGCCACRILLEAVKLTINGKEHLSQCHYLNKAKKLHHSFWEVYVREGEFEIYTLRGKNLAEKFEYGLF